MRRTALELSQRFRDVVGSQSEDDLASFLEDLNDSVSEVDTTNMVDRSELERVTQERDKALASAQSYRDRYINRFYEPGNGSNDQTLIESESSQSKLEKDERLVTYDDLFE